MNVKLSLCGGFPSESYTCWLPGDRLLSLADQLPYLISVPPSHHSFHRLLNELLPEAAPGLARWSGAHRVPVSSTEMAEAEHCPQSTCGKGDVSAWAHASEGRLCRRSPGYRGGRGEKMGQKSEALCAVSGSWPRKHVRRLTASERLWRRSRQPHTDHGAGESSQPPGRRAGRTVSAGGSASCLGCCLSEPSAFGLWIHPAVLDGGVPVVWQWWATCPLWEQSSVMRIFTMDSSSEPDKVPTTSRSEPNTVLVLAMAAEGWGVQSP